ncbi:MAG: recombinase family protein [Planctomycetota bacterium]
MLCEMAKCSETAAAGANPPEQHWIRQRTDHHWKSQESRQTTSSEACPMARSIAAYVRVSSKGQKTDSQEAELRKWLRANGYDLRQVEWYIDKEMGKTLRRPEFDRLQRDIFDGKIRTVISWKLDRLSRRLRDGVNLLARRSARATPEGPHTGVSKTVRFPTCLTRHEFWDYRRRSTDSKSAVVGLTPAFGRRRCGVAGDRRPAP